MKLFQQTGPTLGNQYQADPYLAALLPRWFSQTEQAEAEALLQRMGEISGGELYQLQLADRLNEPVLTQWNPWGQRIDQIEVTALWKRAEALTVEFGLIARPYEQPGPVSRVLQFALVYLFTPSNDIYSCPLAMTDGAARTLSHAGNQALLDRALPHLISRDPAQFWTSGQWMTELTGGSDVGRTETVARYESGQWRLYGRKWFTSAATSQMTLTLARPEGNGPGGKGLALFYLEPRDAQGGLQQIETLRLKDKLGTRKVPTAELLLHGTPATLVLGSSDGIKNITPMLNITRTWNSISAIALMRRGLNLAWDYAHRREAFGARLSDKPLHQQTLLELEAEFAGAFFLTFELVHLLGRWETHSLPESEQAVLRLLTPLTKLMTGKQTVSVLSEVLECFGGAGYVEDTGLPLLLRDAQVLPIWEGTTNVLSLDLLRVLSQPQQAQLITERLMNWTQHRDTAPVKQAYQTLEHSFGWLQQQAPNLPLMERHARRVAFSLGRSLQVLAIQRQLEAVPAARSPLPADLRTLQALYLSLRPLSALNDVSAQ